MVKKTVAGRTKTVFKTDEIPHLWAHQKCSYGRNPQGNLYFEGKIIYSYGPHFPIARLVERKGKTIVFMTTRTYSSITGGHVWSVRVACKHLTMVFMEDVRVEADIPEQFQLNAKEVWESVRETPRAKASGIQKFQAIKHEADKYAKWFNLSRIVEYPSDYTAQCRISKKWENSRQKARLAKEEKLKAERTIRQAKLKAEYDEMLPIWLNCETGTLPYLHDAPVVLRLIRSRRFIQTSLGAIVPVKEAVKLWEVVNQVRGGKRWRRGALKVGGYQVEKISRAGDVKVGCHDLVWSVMLAMAKKLKVLKNESQAA